MANNSAAELQPCATGSTSQNFQFVSTGEIKIGSNYCLDVYDGASGGGGAAVVVRVCDTTGSQKWQQTSAGEIRGTGNSLCVAFKGHPITGSALYLAKCGGTSNSTWNAVPTSTSTTSSAPVASAAVSLTRSSIAVGDTTRAKAVLKDATGNVLTGQTVSWTSSSPSIATVTAAGLITAVAAGTTNIVATSGSIKGTATLTVTSTSTTTQTPPPPSTSGASCSSLVTGTAPRATSALAKPGYLQSVIDPDFGTKITRITGDPGTPIGYGISGSWPTVAYHNYPKDPVFSADQRLLVLKHMSGVVGPGGALFLDGTTYQPLFSRTGPSGGGEWRWHPSLPDIMVYLNGSGTVGHWNVRTNVSTVKVAAVSGYTSNELGPSEGNVSYDGRWMVAKAVRTSDSHIVGRVIDIDGGTVGPVVDLTAAGLKTLDWVSISAGGAYIVAEGDFGLGRSDTRKIYRASDGALISTWSDYLGQHVDLGMDGAGNEVMFSATSQSPLTRHWYARKLSDGSSVSDRTPIGVTSYNWHVSNRMNARPGWGLGSTNDNTGEPFDGEIYMLALDGSQRIERLAHHRANLIDYDSSPFPTPSPDGKRVVFASNWMSSGRPVQTYVVDVRNICP
jgi:hypothetical protein